MKKELSIYLTLILFGFFKGTLFPGDFNIAKVSEWGTGYYMDVFIKGNYAYGAASKSGFDIIDISDLSRPRVVNNISTSGDAVCVYVSGNYAYVADFVDQYDLARGKNGGLKIIDITYPDMPTLVGAYGLDYARKVFVKDNYVYVLTLEHMKIFDLLKPFSPTLLADFKIDSPHHDYTHYTRDICVDDKYAYVISATGMHDEDQVSLAIIDVSDPAAPWLVEELTDWSYNEYPLAICVKGDYAYITRHIGLMIMDVSNPRTPKLIGTCTTYGSNVFYGDIKIRGRYAYLASGDKGLQVVDISNPESPTLVSSSEIKEAKGLYLKDNYVCLASGSNGLQIMDISERESPIRVGEYISCDITGLHYKNNNVYLIDDYRGFHIVDVSNLNSPEKVGTYNASKLIDLYISGEYAYLIVEEGEEKRMDIVDISDPAIPTLAGTYNFSGSFKSLIVSGKYAYILLSRKGLHIVDISDPSLPTLVGTYESNRDSDIIYRLTDKQVNYLYIVYHKGLLVVDISNPASPVETGHLDFYSPENPVYPRAIHIHGQYVYIVDHDYPDTFNLRIIDISHRASPVMVGRLESVGDIEVEAVYVTGNYAYVANGEDGLIIIDVSEPSSPNVVGKYDTPGDVSDVQGTGDYILVADGSSGRLLILRPYDPGVLPYISLDHRQMSFASMAGSGGEAGAHSLIIDNSGGGTLNWSLAVDQDWISCSPVSGTGRGEVSVSVDAAGLPAGTYFGKILVTDPAAVNSPQSAAVFLNVQNFGEVTVRLK